MKKLSLYVFLVLMFYNVGFAQCIEGDCKNGYGTFTFPDGRKYVGESKDNKKHEQGTFTWVSGAEYVEEWKKNEMHGQGTYTWKGGDKYVEEFKDSKSHGQGTYTHGDGTKYVGEFKDSEYHWQGTLTYADGRIDNGIVQKKEKNEKIVIKRENTTNPNVKEKLKKDEETKR